MDGDVIELAAVDSAVLGFALISGFVGIWRGLAYEVGITLIWSAAIAIIVYAFAPVRALLDPLVRTDFVQDIDWVHDQAGTGPLPTLAIVDVVIAIGMFFVLRFLLTWRTIGRWRRTKVLPFGWRDRWLGLLFGLARGPLIAGLVYAVLVVVGEVRLDQRGEIIGGLTSPWMEPLIADLVPATERVAMRTFASSVEGRALTQTEDH